MTTATVPAPTTDPAGRDPATIASAAEYSPSSPIWIYRNGRWCPGLVLTSSERAALVRYWPTPGGATGVDTAIPRDLASRTDLNPGTDAPGPISEQP